MNADWKNVDREKLNEYEVAHAEWMNTSCFDPAKKRVRVGVRLFFARVACYGWHWK